MPKKIILPIRGMHCKSCEILIEDNLKEISGVQKAEADHRKEHVIIYCDEKNEPNIGQLSEAIGKAGYNIGDPEKKDSFISKSSKDYKELGIACLLLLGLYLIARGLGITSMGGVSASSALTLPIVLLIGLTAGVSTCMALVGGLVLGISARHAEMHPEASAGQKFRPHVFFNFGRLLSFTFLGGLLGMVGSIFQLSGTLLGFVTIAIGALMLVMGLQLIEIFPWARKLKLTLPKGISRTVGIESHKKEYSHGNSTLIGALTFFLPCGFTQAMQVYAIGTGSFLGGALIMGTFALGTMPGLLGIGGLTSIVKGNAAKQFFKLAGLVVIIFGLMNISNGFGLAGLTFASARNNNIEINDPNVTLVNGVQIVKMRETGSGYQPNKFTVIKGIPVKWVIQADAPYSCAASIVMSKYNIRKNLQAGENIIEFTPKETGAIKFSCSMGMYTGVFNVVDANSNQAASQDNADTQPANTGGSCGGGGGGCGCGGGVKNLPVEEGATTNNTGSQIQLINSTYTIAKDIQPNVFRVKVGMPVKYVIDPKEDGIGCMSAIMVQNLYTNPIQLEAGKQIIMQFTPKTKGEYLITCAMGMKRGSIVVE
ncbi:MAG: sulfite exporter TauE/SafE family protein [Candidatus Paceibacterota bacterium]